MNDVRAVMIKGPGYEFQIKEKRYKAASFSAPGNERQGLGQWVPSVKIRRHQDATDVIHSKFHERFRLTALLYLIYLNHSPHTHPKYG